MGWSIKHKILEVPHALSIWGHSRGSACDKRLCVYGECFLKNTVLIGNRLWFLHCPYKSSWLLDTGLWAFVLWDLFLVLIVNSCNTLRCVLLTHMKEHECWAGPSTEWAIHHPPAQHKAAQRVSFCSAQELSHFGIRQITITQTQRETYVLDSLMLSLMLILMLARKPTLSWLSREFFLGGMIAVTVSCRY